MIVRGGHGVKDKCSSVILCTIADCECRMFGCSHQTHGNFESPTSIMAANKNEEYWAAAYPLSKIWIYGHFMAAWFIVLTFSFPRLVASVIKIQLCEGGVPAQGVKKRGSAVKMNEC